MKPLLNMRQCILGENSVGKKKKKRNTKYFNSFHALVSSCHTSNILHFTSTVNSKYANIYKYINKKKKFRRAGLVCDLGSNSKKSFNEGRKRI